MELTEEDHQLILEFINETAQLSSHFIDIFNSISKSIAGLKDKSDMILELLMNKQQQVITSLIVAKSKETTPRASGEENEQIIIGDTSTEYHVGGDVSSVIIEDAFVEIDEDEEARVRLAELMDDSYGKGEMTLQEQLYREHNLTRCEVVLQRCDENTVFITDKKQPSRRGKRSDSDTDIDNLCNIEQFLANLVKTDKKVNANSSRNKTSTVPRVTETKDLSSEDTDSESFSNENTIPNNSMSEQVSNKGFECQDMDDELAKVMLERMLEDDECSQISDISDQLNKIEKQKKAREKSPNVTQGNKRQGSLLPPLRLNLFRDEESIASNDDTHLKSNEESIKKKQVNSLPNKENYDMEPSIRITRSKNNILTDRKNKKESFPINRKRKVKQLRSLDDIDDDPNENKENTMIEKIEDSEMNNNSRRKLRKLIEDSELDHQTTKALHAESERLRRIEEQLQKKNLEKTLSQKRIQSAVVQYFDNCESIYLDVEQKLQIDKSISRHLKKHQIEGIQFMWNSCFESVEAIKKEDSGGGCVLAHCMGLGKTLQVIALVHTVFQYSDLTGTKRVLVLTPKNTLLNWIHEFDHWLKDCPQKPVQTFDISSIKSDRERLGTIKRWFENGGVFVTSYNMLVKLLKAKSEEDQQEIEQYFSNPGAELIVCDEGHTLKNDKTAIAKCVSKVRTKRRIVLTGSPLQNNLMEYHCMVSFVKPSLLGNQTEFRNRFANPIANGQHADSTESDVNLMKKRAHCLHKTLDGCVQRMDVIRGLLPPKQEFVISIRLSEVQQRLYELYLKRNTCENKIQLGKLLPDFHNLYRIWSHPWMTKTHFERKVLDQRKQRHATFEGDEDSTSFCEEIYFESANCNAADQVIIEESKKKETTHKITNELPSYSKTSSNQTTNEIDETEEMYSWFKDIITDDMEFNFELSGKMVVFAELLERCEEIGDKLLVFSQSLLSLDLIEKFLKYQKRRWVPSRDYHRIDGSTEVANRKKFINQFNDRESEVKLFLISNKAGGIGVNLVGANRVIIFDASWNPVHDIQSMFRAYRLGQDKPVFIYRFLAQGTMEEKIYNRQVNKQSLSLRVIDEHQLQRHFTSTELRDLYKFDPEAVGQHKATPKLPADKLLANLLKSCDKWISKYHEHDSLLENRLDEGLDEVERQLAWDEYEQEKRGIQINENDKRPSLSNEKPLDQTPVQHNAATVQVSISKQACTVAPAPNNTSSVQLNNSIVQTSTSKLISPIDPKANENVISLIVNENKLFEFFHDIPHGPCRSEFESERNCSNSKVKELLMTPHFDFIREKCDYFNIAHQIKLISLNFDNHIRSCTELKNKSDTVEAKLDCQKKINSFCSNKDRTVNVLQTKMIQLLHQVKGTFVKYVQGYRLTYMCHGPTGPIIMDGPLDTDLALTKRLIFNYEFKKQNGYQKYILKEMNRLYITNPIITSVNTDKRK